MGSGNDQIISNGLITNYGMIDTGSGDDKITVKRPARGWGA